MTIHKLILPLSSHHSALLPKNSIVLCVQEQRDLPCIWYAFDESLEGTDDRTFYLVATGFPTDIPIDVKYVGTFQLCKGSFVGHVYCDGLVRSK